MKKMIALVAAGMLAATAIPASAATTAVEVPVASSYSYGMNSTELQPIDDITAKALLAEIGKYLDIPANPTYVWANPAYGYGTDNAYEISVSYDDMNINLTIADNLLVNYYSNAYQFSYSNTERKYPSLTKEQCKKTAQDFVAKVYAAFKDKAEFAVIDMPYGYGGSEAYNFMLRIKVGGVNLMADGSIEVDYNTGKVRSLYLPQMLPSDMPDTSGIVSADQALATLLKAADYRLGYFNAAMYSYAYKDQMDEPVQMTLQYMPSMSSLFVDAKTGEIVDVMKLQEQRMEALKQSQANTSIDDAAAEKAKLMLAAGEITQEEYDSVIATSETVASYMPGASYHLDQSVVPEGALDKAALEKAARAIKGTILDDTYTLQDVYYYDGGENAISASLNFMSGDINASLGLDATTGELQSMYSYTMYSYTTSNGGGSMSMPIPDAGTLPRDKAVEYATAFAKAQQPAYFSKLKLQDTPASLGMMGMMSGNYVAFMYEHDGIPVSDATMNIGVNDEGLVASYYFNQLADNVTFVNKKDAMSMAELEKVIKNLGVELYYVDFGNMFGYMPGDETQHDYKLCYAVKNDLIGGFMPSVEATTGEAVGFKFDTASYIDVADSKYKDSITALADIDIGLSGDTFEPNKTATQQDFLTFAIATHNQLYYAGMRNSYTTWEELIKQFSGNGMNISTDALSADKSITRMDAVKLLFDLHGYDKTLKYGDVYKLSTTDASKIPAELRGYAAMAVQFQLLDLTNNAFAPDKTMTRGEVAQMIYRFMKK